MAKHQSVDHLTCTKVTQKENKRFYVCPHLCPSCVFYLSLFAYAELFARLSSLQFVHSLGRLEAVWHTLKLLLLISGWLVDLGLNVQSTENGRMETGPRHFNAFHVFYGILRLVKHKTYVIFSDNGPDSGSHQYTEYDEQESEELKVEIMTVALKSQ